MIYSKTLNIADYDDMIEPLHIDNVAAMLGDAHFRFEHAHRKWEYSIILKALRAILGGNTSKTVLDIGGGGSIFAPAASWLGMEVVQVDPEPYGTWAAEQSNKLNYPLAYIQKDFLELETRRRFDAVVSISVIEHVERDVDFFTKMCDYVKPGGVLALTCDFHPSGEALMTPAHLRTYTPLRLKFFEEIAKGKGFSLYGGESDYTYRGEDVNSYTFASLIMERQND